MIESSKYKEIKILPILVDKISLFVKEHDLTDFFIDVGELNVGRSINWKAIILWDETDSYIIKPDLQNAASSVIAVAETMPGLKRITINFLDPMSVMPMHRDSEEPTPNYNMIIPITDNGWFILDDKVIKSTKNEKILFDGSSLHGVMNDSFERRISVYLLISKDRFYDSA